LYICHRVLFADGAVYISVDDSSKTEWTTKSVRQWASEDVMWWIISVANDSKLNAEDISISHFSMIDGRALYMMTEEDFVSREAQFGKLFYHILQRLKQEQDQPMTYDSNRCELGVFFFLFFSSSSSSILYVKVVCMLHVQYKVAK